MHIKIPNSSKLLFPTWIETIFVQIVAGFDMKELVLIRNDTYVICLIRLQSAYYNTSCSMNHATDFLSKIV